MSYRIILRGPGDALLYSNGYEEEKAALHAARLWAKHDDLEVLWIEDGNGSAMPAEALTAALAVPAPEARTDAAA